MRFTHYKPGSIVGPFFIVRCSHVGKFKKTTLYDVQWTCCEKRVSVSHLDISKKIEHGTRSCGPCEKQARREHQSVQKRIHRAKPVEAPYGPLKVAIPTFDVPGAKDQKGFIWPSLGKLGPHWGAAEWSSKRPQAKGARIVS